MRALIWGLRVLVFLFLFAFAAKNTELVNVRFLFETSWQLPLVVLLFAFFAAGALLALLAVSGTMLRLRRELARRRQESTSRAIDASTRS